MGPTMKHRSVVANFIFKWSNQNKTDQHVALFRRSHHPNVRSYQGKFAPISGSIEPEDPNPLTAAKREIQEETQLVPDHDVLLEFCGRPYSFEDHQVGRSWTIHPFGWTMEAKDDKVKIDWEHDTWSWFDPQGLLQGNESDLYVPKLDASLRRVYFGPNGIFRVGAHLVGRGNTTGARFLETIEQLKFDTESGARVLALRALEGLANMADCFKDCPTEGERSAEYWHALQVAAYHLIHSSRPSMNAAISTAVLAAMQEVYESLNNGELDPIQASHTFHAHLTQGQSSEEVAHAFTVYLDEFLQSISSHHTASDSASRKPQSGVTINLVTLSYSSTIFAAFKHLVGAPPNSIKALNITVLESRPRFEGAQFAASLLEAVPSSSSQQCHINIHIVPESHAASLFSAAPSFQVSSLPRALATLVILGADRISPFGNVTNKTGSTLLATLAKTLAPNSQCTKVIVLSERAKIASADPSITEDLKRFMGLVQTKDGGGDSSSSDNTPYHTHFSNLAQKDLTSLLPEPHDAQEVYSSWPADTQHRIAPSLKHNHQQPSNANVNANVTVTVGNVYFETVPSRYIDAFISDRGPLRREEIVRVSLEQRALEDELFARLHEDE